MTADLVVLTVYEGSLQVLLIERGNSPFRGDLALPGGFMRPGESLEQTARRELIEETGMDADQLQIEQVGTFSAADRDPSGRVVTTAYLIIAPNPPSPSAGTDAQDARWFPAAEVIDGTIAVAFDHAEILARAVEQARRMLEYTPVAAAFCGEEFTVADLRRVYEAVWGVALDPGNFYRKVTKVDGFLQPVGSKRQPETGRPAELFRLGPVGELYPPFLRRQVNSPDRPE